METRVKKWGNSLALRIPKPLAIEAGIEEETLIELVLEEGRLHIVPVAEPEPTLEQLLAQVTEENRHGEIDTGASQGVEVW
ncbi:MAG: AbrB/MazE/SpoVT family DNA-binding domain-containing protein [Anaerolineae bacterium]|nr:AbrB/MazE/SpoVT family DNA-binding domain-containing protein [Anaerolineae bacterium]